MTDKRTGEQTERIAAALRADIVAGRLKPDTALRQEHLAERFETSRMPVRDALRMLEAEGLIDMPANRGARVASLDPEGFREVFEMRAAAETLALRHAIPNITNRQLDRAAALQSKGEAASIGSFGSLNKAFHETLYAPCGWARLLAHIDALADLSDRYLRIAAIELAYVERSHTEHHALLDACYARDTEKACALLDAHIKDAGRSLYDALGGLGEGSGRTSIP